VIRVLVASASAAGRAGLEALIAVDPSLEVVGWSAGLTNITRTITDVQPDVVVVQFDPDTASPLAALQAVSSNLHASEPPAVVVLADMPPIAGVATAIQSGSDAFLPLAATATQIRAAIHAAAAGLVVVHPALLALPSERQPAARHPAEMQGPPLTAREVEVLNLMAQGLGNKEIAWRLGISEHTVKFHIGSVFNKLEASSRTEAVTLGIRAGMILL
jgi:two-component system, NarL family, response regulator YdfI